MGFPTQNIKSLGHHKNAFYLNLLFDEFICVGDPIIDEKETSAGVFTHELGHRKYKDHLPKFYLRVSSIIYNAVFSTILVPHFPFLYEVFGFTTEPAIGSCVIGSIFSWFMYKILNPVVLAIRRLQELRADAHAVSLGYVNSSKSLCYT